MLDEYCNYLRSQLTGNHQNDYICEIVRDDPLVDLDAEVVGLHNEDKVDQYDWFPVTHEEIHMYAPLVYQKTGAIIDSHLGYWVGLLQPSYQRE